ncbi:MAG TPA: efflux RND transporter periplasmic adaptor subunit [Longimicrobiales bacterium]
MGRIRWNRSTGLVLLAAVTLPGCRESGAVEADAGHETATAERRTLEIRAEASGLVEPIRIVEVKSKASGEILRLHVETGDRVERGALLAEVDPRDVENAYAQAKADLAVAEARFRTAESQLRRSRELLAAQVITEQEFEAAQLELANARSQHIKAQTNLELAEERLSDVTIRAPLAGTIIQESVEVGQIIQSASQNISGGTTLFLMADLSEMQVRTLVDETDIGRIRAGLPARVSVEAYPDRTFIGRVLKIEPQAVVEQNVTMFPVLVRLDNREGLLKPGMNAEVQIEIARRADVVAVPNAAVVAMRDAFAAGAVLGLDEERIRTALRAARAEFGAGRPGRGGRGDDAEAPSADGRPGDGPGGPRARPARDPDAGAPGDDGAVRAGPGDDGRGARTGGSGRGRGRMAPGARGPGFGGRAQNVGRTGDARPGIVFVEGVNGPEPRLVLLGLNDWDYTEVVRGVEAGEPVVLMSVARLQQQQQEMLDRIRQRAGGPIPGSRRRR